MPPPKSTTKRNYYPSINLFRGLSILFIVWGHVLQVLTRPQMMANMLDTDWLFLNRYFNVYVIGGTAYFVFISGFLFYAVFYKRNIFQDLQGYYRFVKDKILKVFCPYLIAIFFLYVFGYLLGVDLHEIGWGFFTFYTLWYVPFIMVIFLASPLFVEFIRSPIKIQLAVFASSTVLSILMGRHNYNPILSAIFWASMYMFGILIAEFWEKVIKTTPYFKISLLIISIFLATLLCCLPDHTYMTDQPTWEINWGSYYEVQIVTKMVQSICFVYILHWLYNRYVNYSLVAKVRTWCVKLIRGVYNGLGVLAKYSFTIFFYHTYFLLYVIEHKEIKFLSHINFWMGEVIVAFVTSCVLIVIVFIGSAFKKMLGNYSRFFIGA